MRKPVVVKVGGAELQAGEAIESLVEALVALVGSRPVIVVHGGGSDIATLQKRLGLEPCFIEGLRVTDEESLWVAEMVLSGSVNKRLTAHLVSRGIRAIGLSGVDVGLLRGNCLQHPVHDLGRVGEIDEVNAQLLIDLMGLGLMPIISPITLGCDGRPLNVNADHAALAVAAALSADDPLDGAELVFLTDVRGVLEGGELVEMLTSGEAERLIDTGIISGGMIPKVRSALGALMEGVSSARITNLDGLASGSGTWVMA